MEIVKSVNNVPIRLTDERWIHIVETMMILPEITMRCLWQLNRRIMLSKVTKMP